MPLRFADGYATTARVFTFDGLVDGREHLALGLGDRARAGGAPTAVPLVRPHSECLTGDVFGSQRCDCGPQLREAVERIADGRRLPALPAPGGPRHRPLRQARRLRAAGRGPGHLRGQPGARPRRGRARLHRRRADAARAGRDRGRAAEQQPGQGGAAGAPRRHRRRRRCRPACTCPRPMPATWPPRPAGRPHLGVTAPVTVTAGVTAALGEQTLARQGFQVNAVAAHRSSVDVELGALRVLPAHA